MLFVSGTGEVLDTLAMAAGDESVRMELETGIADMVGFFTRSSQVASTGGRLVLGDAVDLEYRVLDSAGRMERIVRGSKDLSLPAEMLQAEIDARLEPNPSPQFRRQIEDLPVPERRPAYSALEVDHTGAVWLAEDRGLMMNRISSDPLFWEVFDPDGRWLGRVGTPGRFEVFEIGTDYVLGVQRDELDVEYVRMYGLTREPSR